MSKELTKEQKKLASVSSAVNREKLAQEKLVDENAQMAKDIQDNKTAIKSAKAIMSGVQEELSEAREAVEDTNVILSEIEKDIEKGKVTVKIKEDEVSVLEGVIISKNNEIEKQKNVIDKYLSDRKQKAISEINSILNK